MSSPVTGPEAERERTRAKRNGGSPSDEAGRFETPRLLAMSAREDVLWAGAGGREGVYGAGALNLLYSIGHAGSATVVFAQKSASPTPISIASA